MKKQTVVTLAREVRELMSQRQMAGRPTRLVADLDQVVQQHRLSDEVRQAILDILIEEGVDSHTGGPVLQHRASRR